MRFAECMGSHCCAICSSRLRERGQFPVRSWPTVKLMFLMHDPLGKQKHKHKTWNALDKLVLQVWKQTGLVVQEKKLVSVCILETGKSVLMFLHVFLMDNAQMVGNMDWQQHLLKTNDNICSTVLTSFLIGIVKFIKFSRSTQTQKFIAQSSKKLLNLSNSDSTPKTDCSDSFGITWHSEWRTHFQFCWPQLWQETHNPTEKLDKQWQQWQHHLWIIWSLSKGHNTSMPFWQNWQWFLLFSSLNDRIVSQSIVSIRKWKHNHWKSFFTWI